MSKHTSENLAKIAFSLYESFYDDPDTLAFATGLVAEGLHRIKPRHTGLISKEASVKGVQICKEHFFGRQASAELIMDQIHKGKSVDRIVAIISSRTRVHYTTQKQNMILRNYSHLHWRKAYKEAGITLIPYIRKSQKYMYKVDDVLYNTPKDVCNIYNITPQILNARCMAKRKWRTWNRERIN